MNKGIRLLLFPVLGLVALVLGLAGHQQAYPGELLSNFLRTVALFFPRGDVAVDTSGNYALLAAQLLAPVATLGSAY